MADPTTVTGLVFRWRASSLALSNGAAVSSWPALVGGSGATLTNGTATAPTYQTSGIGGQPAVKFVTASTQSMVSGTITAQSQPLTYVVVHQLTRTDATIQEVLASGVDQILTVAPNYDGYAGGDTLGGTLSTNPRCLMWMANGASSTLYEEGTLAVTANALTNGSGTTIMFGNHPTANTRWMDGSIAEVLIYTQALNATDRATVDTYVQDQYGITVSDYVPGPKIPPRRRISVAVSRAANF